MKPWVKWLGGLAVVVVAMVIMFVGSVLVYHWQIRRPHQAALEGALGQSATLDQLRVRFGLPLPLRDEGNRACPGASAWAEVAEVKAKCAHWPTTRTFLTQGSEFIYVVYFDAAGKMRDFTLIEN